MTLKMPPVLASQRGFILTDGMMFSLIEKKGGEQTLIPINVVRHGIRGININPKDESKTPGLIQRTETAKTDPDASALVVRFNYRTLPADSLLFACADSHYREHLNSFIARFFKPGVAEFDEVCRRMARNILNGRWLWRNQMLGDVTVEASAGGVSYTSKGTRQRDFDCYTKDEIELANDVIAAGLTGSMIPLKVTGKVNFGFTGAVEVFPSQNMVTGKPQGFARSLYKVDPISVSDLRAILGTAAKDGESAGEFAADMIRMGYAALRDQKISNAIKTIDTWYPGFNGKPIAIEPNGASLELNSVERKKSGSKALLPEIDSMHPTESFNTDAAFLIGLIIRGGVFSEESDK
ncbi:MAG: type I-F CRISPR-associated protein Csy3 [Limnobacter sp.]|uniref:type I-F CRISPR-associated protein Csy3 n=1 Tax=Limnobacter sp. TaxID=2003368 RepID=UPI00391C3E99